MVQESTAPLKINSLTKDYGDLRAVDHVSFELKHGEIFGLLGPNGAGKTSIISCITSLEKPTTGSVEVFGYDVEKSPREAKSSTGIVPQELINHGYFTLREILEFHSGYYGIRKNDEQIEFLLETLALKDHSNKRVRQLSGGMKRRLSIAKALVHKPQLLLLDEPTAGVDIELRETLWSFVRDLKSQGMTVLLTTHYLEEAEELCDRIAVIDNGKIKRQGETLDLISELTHRHIRFVVKEEVSSFEHPLLVENQGGQMVFRIPASMGVGDLLAEIEFDLRTLRDLHIEEGRLEDVFRLVLGESK